MRWIALAMLIGCGEPPERTVLVAYRYPHTDWPAITCRPCAASAEIPVSKLPALRAVFTQYHCNVSVDGTAIDCSAALCGAEYPGCDIYNGCSCGVPPDL